MNTKKIFELATQQGIEALELSTKRSARLALTIYKGELEKFNTADTTVLYARGVVNGKIGYANTETLDATTAQYVVSQIKENADIIQSEVEQELFKGSEKYKKLKTFNTALQEWSTQDKIDFAKKLESKIYSLDKRIDDVEVNVDYCEMENTLYNSYNLKLKSKRNYFVVYAEAVAKSGEAKKTGSEIIVDNNLEKLDIDSIAKSAVNKAVSKLGAEPCKSGQYPCIFDPYVTANLVSFFVSNAIADSVQKHSSLFEGKLNEQVASRCITITDMPLRNDYNGIAFDDEGVATYNKPIISKGVLQTFTYNLETAKKDGVNTTANAVRAGGKMSTGFSTLCVKPSNMREDHMIGTVEEGLYITDVQGLHAGMNASSGNFSLQAEGFMIKNGLLAEPVSLITIAGNLFDLFKNVTNVADNSVLTYLGVECPSIKVKSIAVSGK